ncbi:hypothetical protein I4F81_007884 [Pyropia yezoensis]|uniref:Uncharacterized protein n=1 Tax=Pyropia yezoensis TaxID=2788 RepID=A0ACC3C5B4_PYRYE|nr:hypothetical protein I4F81_007884 [Neopyropia yezoensis]
MWRRVCGTPWHALIGCIGHVFVLAVPQTRTVPPHGSSQSHVAFHLAHSATSLMDIRLLTLYGNCVGLRDCLGLNLLVRPPTASARALLRRTSTLRSAAASHPSLGQLRRAACRSLPPPPTRSFERDDKPGVGR